MFYAGGAKGTNLSYLRRKLARQCHGRSDFESDPIHCRAVLLMSTITPLGPFTLPGINRLITEGLQRSESTPNECAVFGSANLIYRLVSGCIAYLLCRPC